MTYDSKNYSGPGAVGAMPNPGRNAAGQPQTTGPHAAGADSPPIQTLTGRDLTGYLVGLERNPSANVGPVNLSDTSNGTVIISYDYIVAWAKLDQRNVVIVEPVVSLP